jgi:hypothetical protein
VEHAVRAGVDGIDCVGRSGCTYHARRPMHWLNHLRHGARAALGSSAIFGVLAFGAAPARDLLRTEVAAQVDSHLRPAPLVPARDSERDRERKRELDRACLHRARGDQARSCLSPGEVC